MRHPFKPGDPAMIIAVTNPQLSDNIGKVVTFVGWFYESGDASNCMVEASDILGILGSSGEVVSLSGLGICHTSRLMPLKDDGNDFDKEVLEKRQLVTT